MEMTLNSGTADDAVRLVRESYRMDGTFGQLYYRGVAIACTCELPWRSNQPRTSCIPTGTYHAIAHNSPAHPGTWEIINVPGRSGILIHTGNYALTDSLGCILVGDAFTTVAGRDVVTHSRQTLAKLQATLPSDGFTIVVTDGDEA